MGIFSAACLTSIVVFSLQAQVQASKFSDSESSYVLHEKRSHVPPGWTLLRRHDASEYIPLRFGLKQSNISKLEEYLYDSIGAVHSWLLESGFEKENVKVSRSRGWIQVNTTIEEAETVLRTKYHVYEHVNGERHVACEEYHLPQYISLHVDIVTPSIHFNSVLKRQRTNTAGFPGERLFPKSTGRIKDIDVHAELERCHETITPLCLRALYGLTYEPLSPNRNSFAIVEYTPQAYLQPDLDLFHSNFSSPLVGTSPKLVSIDGGVVQDFQAGFEYNAESNLDLQYAMNLVNLLGASQKVTLYQVGDIPQGATFNNLLDALDGTYCSFEGGDDLVEDGIYPDMAYPNGYHNATDCGTTKPANVISTSYGYTEADLSPFYASRQCAEYAKLGLMGVTVIYSSGDYGVAGHAGLCLMPDGSQTDYGSIFNLSFPSTCPYVTSVGATQINPGMKVTDQESACEQVIFSGGGFRNYFAMPKYQSKAVKNYLANHKPQEYGPGVWNSTGNSRGYPDISANGANFAVAVQGRFSRIFGTSAAAPVVGAILTMINDARITIGKNPIGFINPVIYSESFATAFNDITSGKSDGCGTPGFAAVPGWDPVTGLGTPSFPKLLAKWLELP